MKNQDYGKISYKKLELDGQGEGQFYRNRERLSDMDILKRLLIAPVFAFLVVSLIYLYFLCQVRSLVCCKGEGQFYLREAIRYGYSEEVTEFYLLLKWRSVLQEQREAIRDGYF